MSNSRTQSYHIKSYPLWSSVFPARRDGVPRNTGHWPKAPATPWVDDPSHSGLSTISLLEPPTTLVLVQTLGQAFPHFASRAQEYTL
ncbi:hypothetical protein NLI96_g1493 [Meripilus lineatus]|uniref:Uncharacterized protein n=1 Tax=Meripilus lineatus TaxID=2056292 RepID=A0AAD5YMT8_9APHY|nr:hypothetical protein NLI96_g1493 [Physisporinus lineatus]